jgi:hypothetical protein
VDVRTDDNVLPTTPPSGGLPLADSSDLFLRCTEMFVHRERVQVPWVFKTLEHQDSDF